MADMVFWCIAALTVISAAFVVLNNQLLYAAIGLLFTLFGVAGLYVFLWADFIAGVQLLVYIGGILVLIIFGIMLTNQISSVRLSQTNVQQGVGAVVVTWLFIFLSMVISKTPWLIRPALEPESTTAGVGTLLLTRYLLPFEVISVLLLGALIGAAVLSREGN
ncbi:MAG: NADH-quinone oxidoreductase subunit J [Candidatus Marinimicrobia bacterium]|jgi:NADH-quinone oxidoreductase subunit J|nr:NADH-quinone oxidoreductase subunit J [Candidatus Neomarinimicrobiota bacterium]MDP6613875.1 NADH-quinone oxidoreductase subunit J [Candidatus Neomarinimicrobiota bacterium]MDP6861433.1 NADH-quinone oxidoreductase subunit J [Candidatus Neomarinimicrobiota bacterium]HJM34647.1 NADH-quinone oxidoreductase subunit J [Candidatus Neomarinimicrobiota bacterium]HJM95977.1 NADH-quinone oxidoreductase subunit J [Candidatus Neomarinimicrobiota bacterium]|tara:strand:- start:2842 stop:3330 length:489 start_codon:yes stop_codon:yes gene_type:complete